MKSAGRIQCSIFFVCVKFIFVFLNWDQDEKSYGWQAFLVQDMQDFSQVRSQWQTRGDSFYSTAKPQVSSTAWVSLSSIFSFVSYGGKSNRLKQVWALGKFSVGTSIKWRVNRRGPAAPVDPCKALNPWSGTFREAAFKNTWRRKCMCYLYIPWRFPWQTVADELAFPRSTNQWCSRTTWRFECQNCSVLTECWTSNQLYQSCQYRL